MALSKTILKSCLDEAVSSSNLGSKTWCGQTYNDVFSGEILINTLLNDSSNFTSRESAIESAQSMLDKKLITCISKRRQFDDGDRLYCINQKELEKFDGDGLPSTVRESPKATQVKKESSAKLVNKEKINESGTRQQSNQVTTASKTSEINGVASMNLQKLLEKDAGQKSNRGWSQTNNNATVSSGRGYYAGVLKDKTTESANERRLTANKVQVVLSQQKPPQQTQEVILVENSSPPVKEDRKVKVSPSLKTPDIPKTSNIEGSKLEQKQKVKKTLSPSLFALSRKTRRKVKVLKNNTKDDTKVEVNGHSSPATGESVSKSNELSKSWEAFELKLQNNLKKNTDSRGKHDTRDSQGTRGNHDPRGPLENRASQPENVKILIEDSIDGKGKEKIERQFSAEGRNIKDKDSRWEAADLSPEKTDAERMPSVTLSRSSSGNKQNEEVKLSVNGDELTVPSVRARQNSFLGAEENSDGARSNGSRVRGPSFSSSDDHKTVIIEDGIKEANALKASSKSMGSRERGPSFSLSDDSKTVIIEDDTVPNNLHSHAGPVSKTNSRVSNTSEGRERKNSGHETSSENSEAKTRTSSLGKPEMEQRLAGTARTNDEEAAKKNGRGMPKTLADLLARDGKSSPDPQEQVATEKVPIDNANLYKDKLKGLKKVTPYYASGPIKLTRDRSSSANQEKATHTGSANRETANRTNSGNHEKASPTNSANKDTIHTSSANKEKAITTSPPNQEERISTTTIANHVTASSGLQNGQDKPKHVDINNNHSQGTSQKLASNTIVFKSNSLESNSSQKSKFTSEDKKQELPEKVIPSVGLPVGHKSFTTQNKTQQEKSSPNYGVPRLNYNTQTQEKSNSSSPISPARPTSLSVASSPLVAEGSPLDMQDDLARRCVELEAQKRSYENKITELQLQVDYLRRQKTGQLEDNDSSASISDVTSLWSPMGSPGNSIVTSPSITPQATPRGSIAAENHVLSPMSPPPPPPPAPPSIPAPPLVPENHVKPTKPVVNPKTEMKPLFWNRIIASNDSPTKEKCVWKNIKEPTFDTNEFEKLFSKKIADRRLKRTKSLRDDKHFARINGKKVVKLLETNRSRAIGIKMSSLSCQLEDISNAVYNMDTSVVDMESLQSIYDIYPKVEEIQLIQDHLKKLPAVPLDKPEEFMHQLTKMRHFKERLECWLFQDKFSEIIYGIERSLTCVSECSNVVVTNSEIATLLGLVLAYGNYMNGNTQRGQADGFHLDVLLKLRDVKAKDSDMNLLQYTVKQYLKQYERCLDKNQNESRLPSPVSLSNASQVSFDKLKDEIIKMSHLLEETEAQVKKILDECSPAQRNPFEDKMRKFQATAKQKISEEKEKLAKAEVAFVQAVEYFQWESSEKKETPQEFFGLWSKFIDEVKTCVKLEKQQQQIAKKNFSKVEHLNQIREAATKFRKRRQSVDIVI
ncbi:LOW QUALITY PROTEIN: serine/threonine-protein kinase CST20-like [Dendronephthya gigantea]|uniref:LOW QUALITY PROTEIN: serine/threonine-protein kinase CST20-like n=1 Tax=Dendronephthya gigantea TaxID=151771 RepID=UPI00106CEFF0|nr:LOW QUALITY PROTEIN: serine/threonine-protein kinase CST20-like [Dendronephthya gigantea]